MYEAAGLVPLQDGGHGDGAAVRVLMKAQPAKRESLQAEAEVDPMDGEQTWPTEEELQEAEGKGQTSSVCVCVCVCVCNSVCMCIEVA